MKKEKKKIKSQIIKALEVYKGKIGFDFFDTSTFNLKTKPYILDDNDLEVLLITLNNSNKILLTTKCLFIYQNNTNIRIDGSEIESCGFVNVINQTEKKASEFKNVGEYKVWLCSGYFRILKKNETFTEVYLPNSDFGFCLIEAIKKLKFVTNKYEGI